MTNPPSRAKSQISRSVDDFNPTSRTWAESGNRSAKSRTKRGARFWSNRSFIELCGRYRHQLAFPLRRKGESGPDVPDFQVREVSQDLLLRHAGCQVAKHVRHRDAKAADAGLPTPLPRLDRDPLLVVHTFGTPMADGMRPSRSRTLARTHTARQASRLVEQLLITCRGCRRGPRTGPSIHT